MTKTKPCRVLMVCTGNICRSPSAEVVLRHMAGDAGLSDWISVDSAGTADWHTGESPSRLAQQNQDVPGNGTPGRSGGCARSLLW